MRYAAGVRVFSSDRATCEDDAVARSSLRALTAIVDDARMSDGEQRPIDAPVRHSDTPVRSIVDERCTGDRPRRSHGLRVFQTDVRDVRASVPTPTAKAREYLTDGDVRPIGRALRGVDHAASGIEHVLSTIEPVLGTIGHVPSTIEHVPSTFGVPVRGIDVPAEWITVPVRQSDAAVRCIAVPVRSGRWSR